MTKTALIVDDSRSARFVLKRMLETHSLNVDTAESAEQALDYLIDNRPDVIFMDHMMPGMDGFEAVSAIKQKPETATIPIMMYTSQKGEVYVGQARALGAVGVLPKEVEPVEVSKVLASLRVIDDVAASDPQDEKVVAGEGVAELEHLDHNLSILIQDLFDQQRAILRRDLLDGYEVIAARVADEVRPQLAPDDKPANNTSGMSGLVKALVVVLAMLVLLFAWLYWEREQGWLAMQQQNEDLLQALEQQRTMEAQSLIEAQQRFDQYQNSMGDAHNAAVRSIEWAANQGANFAYGDVPLDDIRAAEFERLVAQLLEIGFTGSILIEIHRGNYCLESDAQESYAVADGDLPVADCATFISDLGDGAESATTHSVAFANLVDIVSLQTAGQIRLGIFEFGLEQPRINYPVRARGVSVAEWNVVAAMNNRINVQILSE